MKKRQAATAIPVLITMLALMHEAGAQVTQPIKINQAEDPRAPVMPSSASLNPPREVIVSGTRDRTDPRVIDAARNKILSGKRASSCAFMDSFNKTRDDVTLAYMRDFGLEDSLSNDSVRITESAPLGDVSNAALPSVTDGMTAMPAMSDTVSGCSGADFRFAAGRNRIERKDKSLALGFEAFDNKDYARALTLFDAAWTKVGYEEAAMMLARLHLYGLGTPKDTQKAVQWLEKITLARFDPTYDRLRFNPRDPNAMTTRIEAAFMLARIHERGIGTAKDPKRAREWYAKAADFGFVPALDILGEDALSGHIGAHDPARGVALLKQAAEAGYAPAQYHLAQAYYSGDGTPRDLKLAGAYFEAAARAGHPGALFAVGRIYDLGEGIQADPEKALVYYKEAAVKGDRDAQFALGTYFYSGEGLPKNVAVARQWFDAAARQGQPDAMFNLGAMSASGEGGPKDQAVAYAWLSLAKLAGHQQADAALRALAPKLTPEERARADAILKPAA